jgi:hypothetical protein
MAVPIIPRIDRGRLYFQTVDVFLPSFAPAGSAGRAETHRLGPVESVLPDRRALPPLRRCDDCQLHLTPDVLRALGNCPRWGKPRHGVESRCPAFVAKGGAR